jgi:hypothetical protein
MALSASVNFTANRDELITSSLRICNVVASGETPTGAEINDGTQTLNMMLKSWMADGQHLFTRRRVSLLLEKNKSKYVLSETGDYATYAESQNNTTMRIAAIAAATTLDVATTTGMTAGDYIAVVMDDGNLHKTTIASVTDADTVVITDGLTYASAIDKPIYWFTTKIARPQRVLQAFSRDSSNLDTIITIVSQQEYWALSKKSNDGRVNQVYYDPQISAGYLYVWPETDTVTSRLEMVVQKPFDDLDISTNNVEFPVEWLNAIKFNLAFYLAFEYGVSRVHMDRLERRAMQERAAILTYDREDTSVFFQPDIR